MIAAKIAQISSCFALTGLIWMVQLVHYPAFEFVDKKKFQAFHAFHSSRITWIVLPLMLTELCAAIYLAAKQGGMAWGINLATVLAIWAVTFTLSVPAHNKLANGFDAHAWNKLVATNWARTILWSARAAMLVAFTAPHFA